MSRCCPFARAASTTRIVAAQVAHSSNLKAARVQNAAHLTSGEISTLEFGSTVSELYLTSSCNLCRQERKVRWLTVLEMVTSGVT